MATTSRPLMGQDRQTAVLVRKICDELNIDEWRRIKNISFHFPYEGVVHYTATYDDSNVSRTSIVMSQDGE